MVKSKYSLTKAARRRIYAPKHSRQTFCVANNGKKVRHGESKVEKVWLDKLSIPERSKVIILFGKTYVIDGYDPRTNTCFEFLGNRFHGAHSVFPTNRDVKDKWLGKTPNELYYGTVQRFQLLHDCAFKVYFVWESDYKKGKCGRFYRGKGDNLY